MTKPEFTEAITDYIISKIPPYIGLAILHLNEDAQLQNWLGPVHKYVDIKPELGMDIEQLTPFLIGMVPPLINPMVLPHIQTKADHYAEIHIVEDELQQFWVFFVDQTRSAEKLQQLLQEVNSARLKLSASTKKNAQVENHFSAFYLLDFATFAYQNNAYFPLGPLPVWTKELNNASALQKDQVDLVEVFPFIEVFQYEAASCWENRQDGKVESGVWEEETITGRQFFLKATAIRHEQTNYLLINIINREDRQDSELIQKAREQRLTLDQLARTQKELKKLLDFKNQFVSIVSHDLRSPLGAVIGLSNLLLDDSEMMQKMNENQSGLLTDIKEEMQRLLDYNDKLYHWSNLELGNFKINKTEIEFRELTAYVERMQHFKLKQKNIRFKQEIDKTIDFVLMADETLLGQALNNLVGNAVKFTPEGGQITIGTRLKQGNFEIFIGDTGVGMPKEISDKLFEGFTRKSTMGTYGEKGTGLGLGIVKKIVEAHEFDINVESEPGKGSTFIISVPLN
ncbi:MAG: HAMP domain-containing sensor histidine kinase [Bacteroidetes bacterium]|jgi:signal transduction histidine kinase|nr:HAMP domain-containing sensor histidine kinase [Bacteroidota bacterium]